MKTQIKKLTPAIVAKAKKDKFIAAFFLNLALFITVMVGMMWAYARFYHQEGWFWGWYTYLAIMFLGASALIYVIFAFIGLLKQRLEVPNFVSILKNIGTAIGGLTFLITVVMLLVGHKGDSGHWEPLWSCIEKSNFVLHILCPAIGICSNFICERTLKMKLAECSYGIITAVVYSAHYLAVGYTHLDASGKILPGPSGDGNRFDRYNIFGIVGPKMAWTMIIALSAATFLLCWLCWLANRKIHIHEEAAPRIIGLKKK